MLRDNSEMILPVEIGKTVPFRNGIPFFPPETKTVFDLWMTFRISVSVKKTKKNWKDEEEEEEEEEDEEEE